MLPPTNIPSGQWKSPTLLQIKAKINFSERRKRVKIALFFVELFPIRVFSCSFFGTPLYIPLPNRLEGFKPSVDKPTSTPQEVAPFCFGKIAPRIPSIFPASGGGEELEDGINTAIITPRQSYLLAAFRLPDQQNIAPIYNSTRPSFESFDATAARSRRSQKALENGHYEAQQHSKEEEALSGGGMKLNLWFFDLHIDYSYDHSNLNFSWNRKPRAFYRFLALLALLFVILILALVCYHASTKFYPPPPPGSVSDERANRNSDGICSCEDDDEEEMIVYSKTYFTRSIYQLYKLVSVEPMATLECVYILEHLLGRRYRDRDFNRFLNQCAVLPIFKRNHTPEFMRQLVVILKELEDYRTARIFGVVDLVSMARQAPKIEKLLWKMLVSLRMELDELSNKEPEFSSLLDRAVWYALNNEVPDQTFIDLDEIFQDITENFDKTNS